MNLKATKLFTIFVHVCSLLAIVFIMSGNAHGRSGVTDLTQQEVLAILEEKADTDSYVLIDVRTPSEFNAGHIASAVNIPHSNILKIISLLDPYLKNNIIFYCHSGRRVSVVTDLLTDLDYDNLYHLEGDFMGWKSNQLDIVNK